VVRAVRDGDEEEGIADLRFVAADWAPATVQISESEPAYYLAGDYYHDGLVEQADYTFWQQHFGATAGIGLQADGSGNGVVDTADYVVWRRNMAATSPPARPGDYDRNGSVDETDHRFWRQYFAATSGVGLQADGNGNGIVDAADYVIWRKAVGQAGITAFSTAEINNDSNIAALTADVWLGDSCDHLSPSGESVPSSATKVVTAGLISEPDARSRSSQPTPAAFDGALANWSSRLLHHRPSGVKGNLSLRTNADDLSGLDHASLTMKLQRGLDSKRSSFMDAEVYNEVHPGNLQSMESNIDHLFAELEEGRIDEMLDVVYSR
jgi:hypothetical protein